MPVNLRLESEGLPWIVVPREWPSADFGPPELYAGMVANQVLGEDATTMRGTRYSLGLQKYLGVAAGADAAYLWLGTADLPPTLLTVEVYAAQGEEPTTLALLARSDQPSALGEVETGPFTPADFPTGLRCLRRDKVRSGLLRSAVATGVRYVWRVQSEIDLVLTFESKDPERFDAALADVERLVRTLHVVPDVETARLDDGARTDS